MPNFLDRDYESFAQKSGLRPPTPTESNFFKMRPKGRAFVHRPQPNVYGAAARFGAALDTVKAGGQPEGEYAGYRAPSYEPPDPRTAFNGAYGDRLRDAMAAKTPGQGLMTNEEAAGFGGGKYMPNVTVGGAFGRGENTMANMNELLQNRLRETKDPGTLGALRSRIPAPWMTPGGMPEPAGAPALAPGLSGSALQLSRQNRAMNSGGRLLTTPGGANTGNYFAPNSSNKEFNQPAFGRGGIDATALAERNPDALYGFTPEHRAAILEASPAAQQALAQRQSDYQQRLAQAAADKRQRQGQVASNAADRGAARVARLEARRTGPSLQDALMQQNPELAIAMAEINQKGRAIDQQGQLGLAQILAGKEANAGLKEQRMAAAELDRFRANPQRVAEERWANVVENDQTMTPEEKMAALAAGPPKQGGLAGALAGGKPTLTPTEEKKMEEAVGGDPAATARLLSKLVASGKMTQEEADKKLNELHQQGTLSWLLADDPTRTTDNPSGWDNWWKGTQVDPKTGKRRRVPSVGEWLWKSASSAGGSPSIPGSF